MNVQRKPEWLRRPAGNAQETIAIKKLLRTSALNTVCEEARCPNISECFSRGTATFMILGDVCTRGCRFCAVTTGKPTFSATKFREEAEHVADAADALGLTHVVVTSVARDDLPDGGAEGFAFTIAALRRRLPEVTVEVLVPDFRGNDSAIDIVIEAAPDVINHNLETVPRLYRKVRPGASYQRSLDLLSRVRSLNHSSRSGRSIVTKTGVMLGLGEQVDEVKSLMEDAAAIGVSMFTAGQYMQPSREHLPVDSYLSLAEFDRYRALAEQAGFPQVFVGPLVRSSYHAGEFAASTEG